VVTSIDIVSDWRQGSEFGHLISELTVVLVVLIGAYAVHRADLQELRNETQSLREDANVQREDARRWKERAHQAVLGLSRAIDEQFTAWELTAAEREVALLLLKGLSLKEIAGVRATTEKTVRVQAAAVYNKGNLSGRAELSAFFLEDLLAPVSRDAFGERHDPNERSV